MSIEISAPASNEVQPRARAIKTYAPGLLLCLGAAAAAMIFSSFVPGLSAMIVAIIAGIALTNMTRLPSTLSPGIQVSAKTLLRWGIVFLGLKLVIADVRGLGVPMLLVFVCIVAGGCMGTLLIGRLLRLKPGDGVRVACG